MNQIPSWGWVLAIYPRKVNHAKAVYLEWINFLWLLNWGKVSVKSELVHNYFINSDRKSSGTKCRCFLQVKWDIEDCKSEVNQLMQSNKWQRRQCLYRQSWRDYLVIDKGWKLLWIEVKITQENSSKAEVYTNEKKPKAVVSTTRTRARRTLHFSNR